ncbi:(2Fe-2S)-binding protein [Alkalicella caledoniensis]|uniref:(2Fe-2S)-binding protein n=1 Tax=Alkalicella caledoniensis TaxID=2731377 RepID=A0A7G9W3N3_ALKCA|nr:(2Fe-2S)-binding protein [Alkalicella caledoniensis]QNO13295.1 (2Fe-2S)-binding protein [Alkalicella caledoniensis]
MENEIICYCSSVSKGKILEAMANGAKSLQDIRDMTGACTLGKCKELSPTKRCCSCNIVKILNKNQ